MADGWQVYATCRDPASACELRGLVDASGVRLRILQLDDTDLASVTAVAKKLEGRDHDGRHYAW